MKQIRLSKRGALALLLAAALALVVGAGLNNLNRALGAMAAARARQLVTDALNSAVESAKDAAPSGADFLRVTRDDAGRVQMVTADHLQMDGLAAAAIGQARTRLADLEERGVQLPLGAALGTGVFSGAGPRVRFPIEPVGTVEMNFATEFEGAGINQTRYRIALEAAATVQIVIPTGVAPITVRTRIPVAESILVGEVPESYIQVPEIADALNFAP